MAEKIKLVLEGDATSLKAVLRETFGGLDGVEKKAGLSTAALAGFAAAGVAVVAGMKFAISTTSKFESAVSDLSAITGASGKDLAFLSDQAKIMGATTTKSASEAAEAMKLMASAKPDLLENAQALASVTKQALTLAEAAGATLPEAANTLGASLNQFGAGADQAARFINVLAAGAKEGASEIRETSAALKESGTVASDAGISFETTNAAIQTLSTVAIKGGQAGTNLRNVILKLQNQTEDGFNPAVVGLEGALKNLQKANLDTTELTKLFGLESVTAAKTLINQADSLGTLTDKLTGTSTAYDQASIKTDNMAGDMLSLTSAVEGAAIEFGEELGPSIRDAIQTSTELIRGMTPVAIATAQAIVIAFKPVTVIFQAVGDALETFQAASDASNASLQSVLSSAKAFNKILKPNAELLAELGINIKDIDPRNVDDVTAAMQALNQHSRENNTELVTRNKLSKEFQATQKEIVATEKKAIEQKAAPAAEAEAKEDPAIQKEIDAQAAKYTQLRVMAEQFQLSEEEREVARFERENEQFNIDLEGLVEKGAIVDEVLEMQRQARADAESIHENKLVQINKSANDQKLAQERFVANAKLQVTSDLLGATSQALLQGNKKQFEAGKKLAIAQTLVSTYQGAQQAFTSLSSIPIVGSVLGAIAAAAAVVAGLSRISSIKSQKYNQAHDGLDRNPSEGTFLLKRDEMVLDSGTSQAVRENIQGATQGGGEGINGRGVTINIENLVINPRGSNIDWDDEMENGFIPALDRAARRDIKPEGIVYE